MDCDSGDYKAGLQTIQSRFYLPSNRVKISESEGLMEDFFNLNLWMFFVIGIFGYLLCFFKYKFIAWVAPTVILICVTLPFAMQYHRHPLSEFDVLTWVRIGFSMFIALALPVAGALADHSDRYPNSSDLR